MTKLVALDGGLAGGADRRPPEPPLGPPRTAAPRRHVALLWLVGVLNLFGLVMVLSASSVLAAAEGSSWTYFSRHLLWVIVGIAVFFVAVGIDYRRWNRLAPFAYLGSIAMLVAVLIPSVGVVVYGSRRWIEIGPQRFQPSELAKLGLLLVVAHWLAGREHVAGDSRRTLRPVLLFTIPVAGLIMLQPDLGTTLICVGIVASMLIAGGVPLAPMAKIGGVVMVLVAAAAWFEPYRRERVLAFLDPWSDPSDTTYQSLQSLVGLASGGVDGIGFGESRAKWGFLPNAHTDFIYAVVGEELGLIGTLAILALFVGLGLLGFSIALNASDRFGVLLASGITTWLLLQAFVNMGAVVGLMPITGVTLPFVSFGGTSLMVNMLAVGMLYNVARHSR